ncbi:MAG: hypothetical protein V1875_03045 [Candidatus Altiarchaeota archaeon]
MRVIYVALAAVLMSSHSFAQTSPWRVVVLANSVDGGLAHDFYGYLEGRGIEVVRVDAGAFDKLKDTPFIVVLGGQNSPEGVGAIAGGILDAEQKRSILSSGARGAFERDGAFASGQKVFLFAGYGAQDTKAAWLDGMGRVADSIIGDAWGIGVSAPPAVSIAPKSNTLSFSFPINVSNSGNSSVAGLAVEAYLNGGMRLETEPGSIGLGPGDSMKVMVRLNPKNVSDSDVVTVRVGGASSSVRLNVSGYERIDKPCNICAASGVP